MGGENEIGNVGIMDVGSMESSRSRMHELGGEGMNGRGMTR